MCIRSCKLLCDLTCIAFYQLLFHFCLIMSTRNAISQHTITKYKLCYENYDPYFPDQPVVDLYLPMWAKQPAFRSKPAFIWAEDGGGRSSISYSQLNSSVDSMASQLLIPLQRGDAVLVLGSPGLDLVKVLFSCQRAGLLSVPISPPDLSSHKSTNNGGHHHLSRVLSQIKPKAAVAQRSYVASIHRYISTSEADAQVSTVLQGLKWLAIEDFEDVGHNLHVPTSCYSGCGPEDVYLIQYTSGATGIPKPVLVTAGSAAHNAREARKAYDLHPNSIIHSWLPQYHDCGLMFLLLTVISGATCVLASPFSFVRRPRLWLELMTEFGATCTPVPSFTLPLALKRGRIGHGKVPLQLGRLKNLILINEPIYMGPVEQFVEEFSKVGLNPSSISPSYGLAENCTFVSTSWRRNLIDPCSAFAPDLPSYNKLLPSARLASPLSQTGHLQGDEEDDQMEILVVDVETCEPVEDEVEGEIWVSSPSNASGYLGYPSLSREVFHGRLRGRASQSYVRTGDIGVVKGKERLLYITGRKSDVIKISRNGKTHSYHCHYLETAAYESSPDLLRGGCIAAFQISPEMIGVVAEVQRDEQRKNNGDEIVGYKKLCQLIDESIIRLYKEIRGVDRLVVLVRSGGLPKTTSGKLQRWAARDQFTRGDGRSSLQWLLKRGYLGKEIGKLVVGSGIFFHDDDHHPQSTTLLPSYL